jgi:hypothetical protein
MMKIIREFESLLVNFIDLGLVYPSVVVYIVHGEEMRPIIM